MIAGENAKSTGKNGETFGDAEFEREIGDEKIFLVGVFATIPGTLAGQISVQAFGDAVEVGEEGIVFGRGFEDGLVQATEHADRIAAGGLPELAIEAAEEIDGGVIPAPAEVVGDREQGLQGVRQGGADLERGDEFHGVLKRSEAR